jgi:hypothetical protein
MALYLKGFEKSLSKLGTSGYSLYKLFTCFMFRYMDGVFTILVMLI